jgi:hypothetical protein
MTRAQICTGVLGGGTALVFALALAASLLFPQGSLVSVGWNGGWDRQPFANDLVIRQVVPVPGMPGDRGFVVEEVAPRVNADAAIPAPAPAVVES